MVMWDTLTPYQLLRALALQFRNLNLPFIKLMVNVPEA